MYSLQSKNKSIEDIPDSLFKHKKQFLASIKSLGDTSKWKPGKYKISPEMSDFEILKLLESGKKESVKITLLYARSPEVLAGRIAKKIEADSASIMQYMLDADYLKALGTNPPNAISLFIPNTYELYWDTDAQELIQRMKKEYDKFWNEERLSKAEAIGLTKEEVYILGSIVQSEQSKLEREWPIIARLYLNRLKIKMPLQSDPTVLFAKKDFKANRVYKSDLKFDSPYNTYIYSGLPPGPICMVQPGVIDAVLNPDTNAYLFMCASDKLDGTHNFAIKWADHDRNAAAYHRALNRAGIK